MDVVGASANLQRAESISKVQVAVARKVLDAQRMEGAGSLDEFGESGVACGHFSGRLGM